MIIPDVNVLVGALQPDDPHHAGLVAWLGDKLNGNEKVGLSSAILTGTVRVLTNKRIFRDPPPVTEVIDRLEAILAAPAASLVLPGPRNWSIFADLCRQSAAAGNLVGDVVHAALAIEHGARFATMDSDFLLFPDLDVVNPLEAQPREGIRRSDEPTSRPPRRTTGRG